MGQTSVAQSIEEIIAPVLNSEDLELVDVQYQKEGKGWCLRVFIDKEGGITVEDCQTVSRLVGDLIEIEDLIHSQYILEVSSPGLDRTLKKEKDFLRFKERKARVTTFSPVNKQRNFKGVIKDFKEGSLRLETQHGLVKILLNNISKARLEIEL